MQCIPPYTPLLYSKTGVCRGIIIFLIFGPNINCGHVFAMEGRRWVCELLVIAYQNNVIPKLLCNNTTIWSANASEYSALKNNMCRSLNEREGIKLCTALYRRCGIQVVFKHVQLVWFS